MNSPRKLTEALPALRIKNEDALAVLPHILVERISLKKKENILLIGISSDTWIHKKHIFYLEKEIKDQLFADGDISVKISEKFSLSKNFTPEKLIEEYLPSMTLELSAQAPLLADALRHASFSFPNTEELVVEVPGGLVIKHWGAQFIDYIDGVLNERCSFGIKCSLKTDDNVVYPETAKREEAYSESVTEIAKKAREAEAKDAAAAENEGAAAKPSPGKGKKKRSSSKSANLVSKDKDVFYGRDFNDEAIPIADIVDGMPSGAIRGYVLKSETKKRRDSGFIFKFSLTDLTDSICVKLFVSEDDALALTEILAEGVFVKVKGKPSVDPYDNETVIMSVYGIKKIPDFIHTRTDDAPERRVELHCHTKMSEMDAVSDVKELVKRACEWGQKAIAITDHGVVQAFPEANAAFKEIKKKYTENYKKVHPGEDVPPIPFKVIYGCEIYLVDDMAGIVTDPAGQPIDAPAVVFDIETTGFSPDVCKIIEIGAVKIQDGKIIDRFSCFIDPETPIPLHIEKLTGINDGMVIGQKTIEEVLPAFLKFCEGCVLAAHNADFDMSFIRKNCERYELVCPSTYIDTVALSRHLLPDLPNFRLDTVAKRLAVHLANHHRAVNDAECTAEIYLKLLDKLKALSAETYDDIDRITEFSAESIKKMPMFHALVLVTNETGRVNLYKLISLSHLEYFHRRPRVPKSVFQAFREGLIIGTACSAGELFQAYLRGASSERCANIAAFYDFLELQPLGNNAHLIRDERTENIRSNEDLIRIYKNIIDLGEELGKPVAATGDVHFIDPEDAVYRAIVQKGMKYDDWEQQPPLYLRTTEEMLEEFSFLGDEKAKEIVITNTNLIADMCSHVSPIREGRFPPVIENSDTDLYDICFKRARELYGEDLPAIVSDRLERELESIISDGYAVLYIIAQKIVSKSAQDGYLAGSRGSVGSSFAATMAGVTEVNPLRPHYLCPNCRYSDFDSDEVKKYAGRCGYDMPDKNCPVCGHKLRKLGFDIPFETFLGFKGKSKEPDIDLNFSGDYQDRSHKYTETIFGEGRTFRAGTISTLAEKTACGFVRGYFESKGLHKRSCEIERMAKGCMGVRRSTGQHPGGIIVLPYGEDINSFTPVQRPANDMSTDIVTTHFDYHSIQDNLLKLDLLGHDDPTMIKMLETLTGVDAMSIPLDEPKVMSLFTGTRALGISPADIGGCQLGCLGIPEFGTKFVIGMLTDTKPSKFSELVRISGLSHGTNVWNGNAQSLIKDGIADLSTAICTRDDIMLYLISMGIESETAFEIMENVRKGRGLTKEWEELMISAGVPKWYIWSCEKIQYMFPKAHAAAYVCMAYRIAWFKIYYPLEYYTAYFSIKAKAFDYELMCRGRERLLAHIEDFTKRKDFLSNTDQDKLSDMYIVREMYARGIEFAPIDLYKASALKFRIDEGKIMPSLNSINDVGENAALSIERAAAEAPFRSREDLMQRGKVSSKVIDNMDRLGIISGLPESDQLSLFDL